MHRIELESRLGLAVQIILFGGRLARHRFDDIAGRLRLKRQDFLNRAGRFGVFGQQGIELVGQHIAVEPLLDVLCRGGIFLHDALGRFDFG